MAGSGAGFSPEIFSNIATSRNFAIEGMFATDVGYIFTSVIWAAATVAMIERRFRLAALWMLGGDGMSALGLMHAYQIARLRLRVAQL